jgi:hypothetical protein
VSAGGADPEPPPDVLVQQWVTTEQGDPFGRRVRTDGTAEECSSATAELVDGEWRFGSRPLEWRQVAQLDETALEGLRAAIRQLGVLELPATLDPTGQMIAKVEQVWTVALDGRRHQVAFPGAGLERAPALARLDEALQLALAQALSPD